MRPLLVIGLLAWSGCGSSSEDADAASKGSGEPASFEGSATFDGRAFDPTFGVAVAKEFGQPTPRPGMMIVLSTAGVDCSTNFDASLERGTYVFAVVGGREAKTYDLYNAHVSILGETDGGFSERGSSIPITITEVADRVSGSFSFIFPEADDATSAEATKFSVKNCL